MTPDELERAEQMLARRPEFNWLTQGGAWFRASEVAEGAGVTRNTVRAWCEAGKIPGAVFYGKELGWRMPRSGLIEYFSELQHGDSSRVG